MTPDEKNLLSSLFERIRSADTGPRDAEAERFIAEATRQNPNAAYILSQTVLIQEQAMSAANQRIQELQAQVSQAAKDAQGGSFLGNIGKSLFGAAPQAPVAPRQSNVPQQAYPGQAYPGQAYPGQAYPGQSAYQQPAPSPWGGMQGVAPTQSGGFLSGALRTAAGVAGGVMLAEGISGLFHGGHGNGMMSDIAGNSFGSAAHASENITNNYYGDSANQHAADVLQDQDQDQDDAQDASGTASDFGGSYDDGGGSGGDSFDA